jgi:hypothetical protein
MPFNLKTKESLFGIDAKTSTSDTPVFLKNLEPGIGGEANRDGTIFVDKQLNQAQREEAVNHEKEHLCQMKQGKLDYTNDTVTWKKDTRSPARVYTRQMMNEGAHNLPWEKEAYYNTKRQKT